MATTVLTGRIIRSGSIPATALGGGVISSSTSFATTGSNSFIGNQNINGTVYLTGSLIPSGNFLYDLGSETNSFRDLFISTGSIRFHNPDGTEQGRITVDARSGDISLLKTAGLTHEQKATIRHGNINPDFLTAVSASNLFVQTKIVMPIGGTVNGINLTAFSSSVASTLSNQSAATSSYAINSTIQEQLASVVSSSTQVAPLLPGGTVSASGQVLLNTVSGTTFSNTAFYFPLDLRVDGTLTAQQINTEYVSSSVIFESGSTKFGDTTDDVMSVTGSILVLGGRISGSMVGMFSSSTQVDYNSITNKLSGVVSSSTQFNALSGTSASYAATASNLTGGTANYIPLWASETLLSSSNIYQSAGNVGIGTATPSASLHVSGTMMIQGVIERVNVTGSAPPTTLNVNAISGSVFYLSASSANNWTINFRGSAATSLNSMMYPGQSMTFAVLVNHSTVGYTASVHQIDGTTITPRWQGGTLPSGSGTSTDIYSYTLIKTANAAFNIFAAQTKFA
jgi:hypothetical protein